MVWGATCVSGGDVTHVTIAGGLSCHVALPPLQPREPAGPRRVGDIQGPWGYTPQPEPEPSGGLGGCHICVMRVQCMQSVYTAFPGRASSLCSQPKALPCVCMYRVWDLMCSVCVTTCAGSHAQCMTRVWALVCSTCVPCSECQVHVWCVTRVCIFRVHVQCMFSGLCMSHIQCPDTSGVLLRCCGSRVLCLCVLQPRGAGGTGGAGGVWVQQDRRVPARAGSAVSVPAPGSVPALHGMWGHSAGAGVVAEVPVPCWAPAQALRHCQPLRPSTAPVFAQCRCRCQCSAGPRQCPSRCQCRCHCQ